MMIYSESGDSKTTQLYFLAKWIFQKYGLRSRLISADGGGYAPFVDSGMIARKEVDVFDISNRKLALADLRRLSEGYWPRYKRDGGEYFKSDEKCLTSPEQFKEIGAYLIEGASSISKLLLNHISKQEEGVGFKYSYKYEEDGYTVGGLQEGHYGLVQKELHSLIVQGFEILPVKFVVVTALVGKGETKRKGETVYGPQAAGNALTPEIPSWFMDCFHLQTVAVQKEDKVVEKKVAWFIQHKDHETEIPYLAKVRVMPELMPSLLNQYPEGYAQLGFKRGIDKFIEYVDKMSQEEQAKNETAILEGLGVNEKGKENGSNKQEKQES